MRATLFSILNLLNLLIIFEHLALVGPTLASWASCALGRSGSRRTGLTRDEPRRPDPVRLVRVHFGARSAAERAPASAQQSRSLRFSKNNTHNFGRRRDVTCRVRPSSHPTDTMHPRTTTEPKTRKPNTLLLTVPLASSTLASGRLGRGPGRSRLSVEGVCERQKRGVDMGAVKQRFGKGWRSSTRTLVVHEAEHLEMLP